MDYIGRYQILRKLGRGGMGSVFKAVVPVIDKVVAVKILHPFEALEDMLGLDKLKEIFTFEATTMAAMHHTAVVDVWDFDVDEQGRPYFVMEFFCNNLGKMIGETFDVLKKSRRIMPEKSLDYGLQLLDGLAFLHDNDIVHRDIKPFNIMITDEDKIRICDFGMALAKGVSFSGPEMMQIGSPFYAAPEQNKKPAKVDGRADLYATGILLYRMLTGQLPSMQNFSLSMVNPLFDSSWDAFFAKAINLQPELRFQTAGEMADALAALQLHWRRAAVHNQAVNHATEFKEIEPPRSKPANVCGQSARKLFGLNELFHSSGGRNQFSIKKGEKIIADKSAGLLWQQKGSQYALSWSEAVSYVTDLNEKKYGGTNNWRLPTVNELFSLVSSRTEIQSARHQTPRKNWLWSSDQHGKRDAWFVDLDMKYADWQDAQCRNFVRAVCSQESVRNGQ
ncbi:MAG: protein kinase [Desulfobulbaceae bacterium]|nr:protein kinase [Desulfobulbaceae bacterium]